MAFVANAGGTAGGGVVVGLIMAFYKLDIKTSIAMSNASVVFAALIRYFINFKERDVDKRVLIDYNYTTLMLPMVEIGATVGVIVNVLIPEIIIVGLLTVVLGFVSVTTTLKYIEIVRKENK